MPPGADAVRTTTVITGQAACVYGRYNSGWALWSSPLCSTSPITPTTVSHGALGLALPSLMRVPTGFRFFQKRRAIAWLTMATPGAPFVS